MGWTCLIIFGIAQWFPIGTLTLMGQESRVTYWGALRLAWDSGYYSVSVMTGLVGFWFPLLMITLTLQVLHAIVLRQRPFRMAGTLRLIHALAPWSMATVLILGILVSIVKMAGLAHLQVGPGLIGFFLLSFMLTGLGRWNAHNLWRHAEDAGLVPVSGQHGTDATCETCGYVQARHPHGRCGRCHAALGPGRRGSASEVWALMLGAMIFYIPANVLPMMELKSVLGDSNHTILGGVIELWQIGSMDLAIIVFVASVMVPITKLIALAYLLLRTTPQGQRSQKRRTRLYAAVEFIGQWSMLDVFVVVLMAAMADFPGLSQIIIGPAALNFGAVVVLTMWAAMRYDPRWGWDRLRASQSSREPDE